MQSLPISTTGSQDFLTLFEKHTSSFLIYFNLHAGNQQMGYHKAKYHRGINVAFKNCIGILPCMAEDYLIAKVYKYFFKNICTGNILSQAFRFI